MVIRVVLAAALLLGGAACSEAEEAVDENAEVTCEEAWERLSEEQQQLIDELGSDAPILDFSFPIECFDE
jgi:hypothetical protein